ncbi:MAG: M24 family metallopeptidase [Candidatus Aminicenantaceae bacterium]
MNKRNPKDNMKRLRSIVSTFIIMVILSSVFSAEKTNIYSIRRDHLREKIQGRAVLFSGEDGQAVDKDFFYLTGIKEPNFILLITSGVEGDFLFVSGVDDEETIKMMAGISGILNIFPLEQFDYIFTYALSWEWNIYFPSSIYKYDYGYSLVLRISLKFPHLMIRDLSPLLAEMRMIKSEDELEIMKTAIEITAAGLFEAVRLAEPGMYEYEIQKIIEDTFYSLGAERTGFPSIIGSGPNSVIIHYDKNVRKTEPGDLIVMDVGAEYLEYTGDLTRTIPVSGKFTPRQQEIYEIVLEAQRKAINACRPGATLRDIDLAARNYIEEKGYGRYFIHTTSHSLGLSVHDSWIANAKLAPGMVITVEPGIYISEENLGVRIEDDVLITEGDCIVLSSFLPKNIEEIERLMAEKWLPYIVSTF